jgi:[acyl-carrier-protein] S-malonyltransferase
MSKTAFLFPGQGSQYVGMMKDFFDADADSRSFIEHADSRLGIELSTLCFNGPEDLLRQTEFTQPAIFVHSILVARKIRHVKPDMVAGHSLGEYTALVAAGALSFEEGLRLVRLRGQLMQRAGTERKGTMAAIVGLAPDLLEEVCSEASRAGIVQPANFNSPGQVVISGSREGVGRAMELAKARGAGMVKELVVSGAFHSPLMEGAREGLLEGLAQTEIRDAYIPVYANVTGEPVRRAADIREMLSRQLTHPVQWEKSVRNMARDGARAFCELGPGKVLRRLVERTVEGAQVTGFEKLNDIP